MTETIHRDIERKAREWIEQFDSGFLAELIDTYLDDTPNRLHNMRGALDAGEAEVFVREAHTLKSSSANLGAMRLSQLAQRLEATAATEKEILRAELQQCEEEDGPVKAILRKRRGAASQSENSNGLP